MKIYSSIFNRPNLLFVQFHNNNIFDMFELMCSSESAAHIDYPEDHRTCAEFICQQSHPNVQGDFWHQPEVLILRRSVILSSIRVKSI